MSPPHISILNEPSHICQRREEENEIPDISDEWRGKTDLFRWHIYCTWALPYLWKTSSHTCIINEPLLVYNTWAFTYPTEERGEKREARHIRRMEGKNRSLSMTYLLQMSPYKSIIHSPSYIYQRREKENEIPDISDEWRENTEFSRWQIYCTWPLTYL